MTIEQIRELHQRRPFQPFEIHLADVNINPVANGSVRRRRR